MKLIVIAAVAENGIIGADGKIPWHIREDMDHFKHETSGSCVIMGRKTWESLKAPLVNRTCIVVTATPLIYKYADRPNYRVASFAEAIELAKSLDRSPNVYAIGGAKIYEEALLTCDEIIYTHLNFMVLGDTKFPDVRWQDFVYYDRQIIYRCDGDTATVFRYRRK